MSTIVDQPNGLRCVAEHSTVDSRLGLIQKALEDVPDFSSREVPGLERLLHDHLAPDVDVSCIEFLRRLLQMFRDSETDSTYQDLLNHCTEDEKKHLSDFVKGAHLDEIAKDFQFDQSLNIGRRLLQSLGDGSDILLEHIDLHDEKGHLVKKENLRFQNWGRTVENDPKYTYVPTTVAEVQEIVRDAKKAQMSVRCAGYRHSWSSVFGSSGEVLISMLPIEQVTKLPDFTSLPGPERPPNELEKIELLPNKLPGGKRLVSVGPATTLERFRRWCIDGNIVTIPSNIIEVEISFGGANGPICHGAGRRHKTLSDLVKGIEYVDAHGEVQHITSDDSDFLSAASGCFGLLGVVTRITLELDPMTYAEMRPAKVPVVEAIPPPPDMPFEKIPLALRPKRPFSDEEKKRIQKEFEEKASNDYYAEWFWFPYADRCWVNCWNNTTDSSDVIDWPTNCERIKQWLETFALNLIQYCKILNKLIEITHLAEAAVTLQSRLAMIMLPEVKEGHAPIKTYVSDALHFQRGVTNVRVRDLELSPKADNPDKPDLTIAQRAWWDAILKAYEHSDSCPQRMPLEMRITGGSDVIMAPQRGNTLGTCSIEILTLQNAIKIWQPYAQKVLDQWMSYTDAKGNRLKTRPHWAKEWGDYLVDGEPWINKLKNEDYVEEIRAFKETLARIGEAHGWTLADLKARFSNELFDKLILDDVSVAE